MPYKKDIVNLDRASEDLQNSPEQVEKWLIDKLKSSIEKWKEALSKKIENWWEVLSDMINLVETLSWKLKTEIKTEEINLSEKEVSIAQEAIKESAKLVLRLKQELSKIKWYKEMAWELINRADSKDFDLENSKVLTSEELAEKMPLDKTHLLWTVGENMYVLIPYKKNKWWEWETLEIDAKENANEEITKALWKKWLKIKNIIA